MKRSFPERIAIELTPNCNLACPMCPRHYVSDKDGFMNPKLWMKLIDEIAEYGDEVAVLPFWRGESLLHKEFLSYMNYAFSKAIRIHFSTNGVVLNEEIMDTFSRFEFLNFSVHTKVGLESARKFMTWLKAASRKGPEVQVSFVTGEPTEKYVSAIVGNSNLEGFSRVRLYERHTKDGIFGHVGDVLSQSRRYCSKLLDSLVISYNGAISRCSYIWTTERETNVGATTIKEAWESEAMEKIRSDYPDKQCASCDQWIGETLGKVWTVDSGKIHERNIQPFES